MATVDPFRPHEVMESRVISDGPIITVKLVIIKMLDDDSLAYGCRVFSSIHSRITGLHDNEQDATREAAKLMIAVPSETTYGEKGEK